MEITAVLAKHPEHALDAKRQYGAVHAVETMEALMELRPDCAFVLSPKANHPEQVVKLLENGISVLCEKPLAMTDVYKRQVLISCISFIFFILPNVDGRNPAIVPRQSYNPVLEYIP